MPLHRVLNGLFFLLPIQGIRPDDVTALSAKMKAKNLGSCNQVLCLLKRYRTLIPTDNAAFNTFFEKIHPGRPASPNADKRYGIGWYNVWRDTYSAADGTAAIAQLDSILTTYYPSHATADCSGQITATSDVARPCAYSWLPGGSRTTFGCENFGGGIGNSNTLKVGASARTVHLGAAAALVGVVGVLATVATSW